MDKKEINLSISSMLTNIIEQNIAYQWLPEAEAFPHPSSKHYWSRYI